MFRRLLCCILLLMLLPLLLAALLWLGLPYWLAAHGMVLQVSDWQLHGHVLHVGRLQLQQQGYGQTRLQLDLHQLQLEWTLDGGLQLRRLAIATADVQLPPAQARTTRPAGTLPAALPAWLPQRIELPQLTLHGLPAMPLQQPLNLQLQQQDAHQLQLQAGTADGLQWRGRLQLDAGALILEGGLQPLALAGGALQRWPQWPALLSVSAGKLQLTTWLRYAPAQALQLRADLQLQGVQAIYDRLAIQDLDTQLHLQLQDAQLQLDMPALQLTSLDAGLPLGPLQLRGRYRASLAAPADGMLHLDQLEAGLLGGSVQLQPAQLSLNQWPYALTLQLQGLDIAALLRAYPAEGLAGSGLIDGTLPLRLERDGLRIENGQIGARIPGGVLQIRSPGLLALGQGNPAMQLVARALDDFRYDRLQSRVSLATSGQLQLALQLSGHNPALEHGRVVNLNVNLEEDLPALLTSLQLSGRVNDAIRQRLQQRLQKHP